MHLFCRRIHGVLFSTSLLSSRSPFHSARAYVSATLEPHMNPEEPAKFCVAEMFNESDIRRMVDKFKLLSRDKIFRKRSTVYIDMVRCLTVTKKFSWIDEILEDQKQYMRLAPHEGFISGIIGLYGNVGMFDHARKLFDEMPQIDCNRTLKSFNALLEACIRSNRLDELEKIFREIPPKLNLTPNTISYSILIKGYLKMGSLDSMLSAVKEMKKKGLKLDSTTYALLLDGFYQNEKVSEAHEVWDDMKRDGLTPCIKSYNSKVRFFASENNMKKAVEVITHLKSRGLKPDCLTFCALFEGFRAENNLAEAKRWFKKIPHKGFRGGHLIFEILVPFAIDMRNYDFALELCRAAIRTSTLLDEATLQAVVDALVKNSKLEEAKALLNSIRCNGLFPPF